VHCGEWHRCVHRVLIFAEPFWGAQSFRVQDLLQSRESQVLQISRQSALGSIVGPRSEKTRGENRASATMPACLRHRCHSKTCPNAHHSAHRSSFPKPSPNTVDQLRRTFRRKSPAFPLPRVTSFPVFQPHPNPPLEVKPKRLPPSYDRVRRLNRFCFALERNRRKQWPQQNHTRNTV
jgi:hypothetical protein